MREKLVVRISDDSDFTEAESERRHTERRLNRRARLDIDGDEIARMVTEFSASRGITQCKPAYAALSPQYRV